MRWPGANLEEKHEPRGVSVAEAQNGDSMKSSRRSLTLAAIEKRIFSGVPAVLGPLGTATGTSLQSGFFNKIKQCRQVATRYDKPATISSRTTTLPSPSWRRQ